MSNRALFKNTFQQIRRLWKELKRHDVRLEGQAEYVSEQVERINVLNQHVHDTEVKLKSLDEYVDRHIELISVRVDTLEDVAHTPSEAECDAAKQEVPSNNSVNMTFNPDGAVTVRDAPAPEPTGEPNLITMFVMSPNWKSTGYSYHPATPAQIRQAAVDAGMLDTERQKVAEAFLEAWLTSCTGIVADFHDGEMMLMIIADYLDADHSGMPADRLMRMAAVLESAKGEK